MGGLNPRGSLCRHLDRLTTQGWTRIKVLHDLHRLFSQVNIIHINVVPINLLNLLLDLQSSANIQLQCTLKLIQLHRAHYHHQDHADQIPLALHINQLKIPLSFPAPFQILQKTRLLLHLLLILVFPKIDQHLLLLRSCPNDIRINRYLRR